MVEKMNVLYHDEKMTLDEVGERLGVSGSTVARYVKNRRNRGARGSRGLEHYGYDKWTEDELEYFMENWEDSNQTEMALDLGKSVRQIRNKAQCLRSHGIIKPKYVIYRYTDKDIEYIIKNYKSSTRKELAYVTRTTPKQIENIINHLKKSGKIQPKYKRGMTKNSLLQQQKNNS